MNFNLNHSASQTPAHSWGTREAGDWIAPSLPLSSGRASISSRAPGSGELLCIGVMLVGLTETGETQVIEANALAHAAMRCFAHLTLNNQTITSTCAHERRALQTAWRRASEGACSLVRIKRRDAVTLYRQTTCEEGIVSISPAARTQQERYRSFASLLFEKSPESGQVAATLFGKLMALTPAEQQVLERLCAGLSTEEAAALADSSLATVRTHIRHILEKTGARGIRDLVTRVANLPPIGCGAFRG